MEITKIVARDVLRALAGLHDACGVAHGST